MYVVKLSTFLLSFCNKLFIALNPPLVSNPVVEEYSELFFLVMQTLFDENPEDDSRNAATYVERLRKRGVLASTKFPPSSPTVYMCSLKIST